MDLYFSVMQCWPDAKQGDRQLYLPFMKKELTDTRMIKSSFPNQWLYINTPNCV